MIRTDNIISILSIIHSIEAREKREREAEEAEQERRRFQAQAEALARQSEQQKIIELLTQQFQQQHLGQVNETANTSVRAKYY